MLSWLIRLLLAGAGVVAGWFVPRDQLGYTIVQFVVVILLILIVSIIILYFPRIRAFFKGSSGRKND